MTIKDMESHINNYMELYKILPEIHHDEIRDCIARLQTLVSLAKAISKQQIRVE